MQVFSVSKLFKSLFLNFFRFNATDDTGGGGGGGPEITPEIQALIDARINEATSGLKAKNSELLGSLQKQKETLKQFEGIDVESVKQIMARFENDEEAKLMKDGKFDQVIERRTEKLRAESERQVQEALQKAQDAEKRAKSFEGLVLDNHIRAAAATAGMHPQAIEDALFRGRSIFTLDAEGKAIQLGEDKHPVLGKDGKSPFTPAEWLDSMKATAPHWFPTGSTGAGGGQGGNNRSSAKTITRDQFEQLDVAERANVARSGITIVD
ncbi:hypothetical protein [Herbaspirillum huttiense]|uniref:hypothetical protein n=1 Tax=Herbaspirillum huttiense TaxID=863372 RepID=UPI003F3C6C44